MIHFEEMEIPWKVGITIQDIALMEGIEDPSLLICLNELAIPKSDWGTTLVPDDGRIIIISMMSGG